MQWFYDGQIRRYVGQIIRTLSGFKYRAADGKEITVPVMYGDLSRQVANIIKENSENKIPSAPRIAVYITELSLDKTRLSDATHISKVHIREREYNQQTQSYEPKQGSGYTVERLMPTPYKLAVKADIWATNTDQKLQIMEQILMLFNPSLELQTTDNFIDWASISVLEIRDIIFTSKAIPQGIDSEIDIGTITFETPIWISPPSKVKRMGVIHDIIMNIHDDAYTFETQEAVSLGGFDIFVYADKTSTAYIAELLDPKAALEALSDTISADTAKALWNKYGQDLNWRTLLDQYGSKYKPDSSQIFLIQPSGNEIIGTISINLLDETKLIINLDPDTYNTNTVIIGPSATKGTVDAIVNPETFNPSDAVAGTRYLILNDIADGTSAWNGFTADANDIVEFDGTNWSIVMDASTVDEVVYTTNLRTRVQYKFEAGEWTRAFEGEYREGQWRLML